MDIEIKHIRLRDYKIAIEMIIKELHLDLYIKNKFLRKAYSRYYWYIAMNKATNIYGAFSKTRFLGCLLLEMKNRLSIHYSVMENIYIKVFSLFEKLFLKNILQEEKVTKELLKEFLAYYNIDGKILFLGTIETKHAKRVRNELLKELSNEEPNKIIYVSTNNLCSYENYESLGFDKMMEDKFEIELTDKLTKVDCYIYKKKL